MESGKGEQKGEICGKKFVKSGVRVRKVRVLRGSRGKPRRILFDLFLLFLFRGLRGRGYFSFKTIRAMGEAELVRIRREGGKK